MNNKLITCIGRIEKIREIFNTKLFYPVGDNDVKELKDQINKLEEELKSMVK